MQIKARLIPQLNNLPAQALVPDFSVGSTIPRVIHQVGMRPAFQDKVLPPLLKANVAHLQEMNPGWDYRFYDDDDISEFIRGHYPPEVWNLYQRIDPRYGAARADLFRYLLIYKVGGVYLDIKSSTTRPLDDVIQPDDRFIVSQWHTSDGEYAFWGQSHDLRHVPGGEFQQWHIVSVPGHPFLKAVIEQVLSNIRRYDPYLHETGKFGVLRLTGPTPYTVAIDRILACHPHRFVEGHDQLGFDYNVYSRTNRTHVQEFKNHYTLQTASVVRLNMVKRGLSQGYRLAQYCHNRLHRRNRVTTGTT